MKKQKTYFFLLLLIGFLGSCSSKDKYEDSKVEPNSCSMIFIDKSVSVNINKAFINEKYTNIINQLIDDNVKKKGDKIEVYFVHENTAKGKAAEMICRSEMEKIEGASSTDSEAIATEFNRSLQRERSIYKKMVLTQLASQNSSSSKNSTDIIAALPLIDQQIAKGYNVKAYFLSDMVESMQKPNRRDFHSNPPTDDAAAVGWAREDVVALKPLLPNITTATIYIAKPFEPTASSRKNNPAVSSYWQRLFMELGITNEVVEL